MKVLLLDKHHCYNMMCTLLDGHILKQVSKCEKFGYGYMLSQVVATAPGVVALQQTGKVTW